MTQNPAPREILTTSPELAGAGFWVTMGFYGHVKSRYTFWGHLGPFPQLRQISPELATSSGNRKPRQVNRITAQVLVLGSYAISLERYAIVASSGEIRLNWQRA